MGWFRRHGLSLVLGSIWLGLLAASGLPEENSWLAAVLENHAGDAFGALLIVLATKRLIEVGSAESKNHPDDEG